MMCVCRRCQRLAAAMDDDALTHVDDDIADLLEVAFQVAQAHGALEIGFEHVLHAMTSLDAGQAWLVRAGVDVAWLRAEAAHVMSDAADLVSAGFDRSRHAPPLDEDVTSALVLAAKDAAARGEGHAQLGDLLAVLMGYQPGVEELVALVAVLRGSAGKRGELSDADGETLTECSGEAAGLGIDCGIALGGLEARLAGIEARADDDRQRIVSALHELSRQRERLPAAEDWRSQMQGLATQIDVMQRQFAEATAAAEVRHERTNGAIFSGHDQVRQAAKQVANADSDQQGENRERDRRIAGVVAVLERQERTLERISEIVERLERAHDGVVSISTPDDVTKETEAHHARQQVRIGSDWGASASAVAASAAAMLATRAGAGTSSPAASADNCAPASVSDLQGRHQHDRLPAVSQRGSSHTRGSRRPPTMVNARARRRTRRPFGGLEFSQIARLGLGGRPKRRERSWWRWLTDRERWRSARRQGARFRAFGERFNHRGGRSRGRTSHTHAAREVRIDSKNQTKRFYLSMDDDIVDAPSIGPKTAERLRPARIFTVRDLLNADADDVAGAVTARHISAQVVRDWQDQARLVLTVPFLRGTHAQLLVGAGFRSYEEVALADQATLMSALLMFATTREGQSILRNGPPPDLEKVIKWMEYALESEPARAA